MNNGDNSRSSSQFVTELCRGATVTDAILLKLGCLGYILASETQAKELVEVGHSDIFGFVQYNQIDCLTTRMWSIDDRYLWEDHSFGETRVYYNANDQYFLSNGKELKLLTLRVDADIRQCEVECELGANTFYRCRSENLMGKYLEGHCDAYDGTRCLRYHPFDDRGLFGITRKSNDDYEYDVCMQVDGKPADVGFPGITESIIRRHIHLLQGDVSHLFNIPVEYFISYVTQLELDYQAGRINTLTDLREVGSMCNSQKGRFKQPILCAHPPGLIERIGIEVRYENKRAKIVVMITEAAKLIRSFRSSIDRTYPITSIWALIVECDIDGVTWLPNRFESNVLLTLAYQHILSIRSFIGYPFTHDHFTYGIHHINIANAEIPVYSVDGNVNPDDETRVYATLLRNPIMALRFLLTQHPRTGLYNDVERYDNVSLLNIHMVKFAPLRMPGWVRQLIELFSSLIVTDEQIVEERYQMGYKSFNSNASFASFYLMRMAYSNKCVKINKRCISLLTKSK